ncbi:MAG: hypothetical protein P4L67_00365 [Candidatus Pacebacteria bacterium]|nr:hypothetical protein [Candidatus Paceibacterota bacterium]
MDNDAQERKIFIWIDEVEKLHVSLSHQSKEELRKAFDWSPDERLLFELPFKLEGAEGLAGEAPRNYYGAIEGLLKLQGIASTLEILLAQMVQAGVDIARYLPVNNRTIH